MRCAPHSNSHVVEENDILQQQLPVLEASTPAVQINPMATLHSTDYNESTLTVTPISRLEKLPIPTRRNERERYTDESVNDEDEEDESEDVEEAEEFVPSIEVQEEEQVEEMCVILRGFAKATVQVSSKTSGYSNITS